MLSELHPEPLTASETNKVSLENLNEATLRDLKREAETELEANREQLSSELIAPPCSELSIKLPPMSYVLLSCQLGFPVAGFEFERKSVMPGEENPGSNCPK